ncbi:hypothetical protein TNCV_4163371 [Trichonephila clavipes]|nr:hypothetical protein TNCV_4163371 [Trichonephila clavipes]
MNVGRRAAGVFRSISGEEKWDSPNYRINTGDNLPVKQREYRVSPAERRIVHDEPKGNFFQGITSGVATNWSCTEALGC